MSKEEKGGGGILYACPAEPTPIRCSNAPNDVEHDYNTFTLAVWLVDICTFHLKPRRAARACQIADAKAKFSGQFQFGGRAHVERRLGSVGSCSRLAFGSVQYRDPTRRKSTVLYVAADRRRAQPAAKAIPSCIIRGSPVLAVGAVPGARGWHEAGSSALDRPYMYGTWYYISSKAPKSPLDLVYCTEA
jgi:hypothetical protein